MPVTVPTVTATMPVAAPSGRRKEKGGGKKRPKNAKNPKKPAKKGKKKAGATKPARLRVLDRRGLHVVNRFTGGWTPAVADEVRAAGGIDAWFEQQISGRAPDAFYRTSAGWWTSNTADTATLVGRNRSGAEPIWVAVANYERWCLVRRIHSERQVVEALTAFWEHHLHVPAGSDAAQFFRASYGRTLRSLALTSFEQILQAAITHPAMGTYLDNSVSTKRAPNENLGRELLEVHTVGRDAGYTEAHVKDSARILTGYRVDEWNTWRVHYDSSAHWTGPVQVLGFQHANRAADGREVTTAYLSYLARHPATAHRIAHKLAVRFVSDNPSPALVRHLAKVYSDHGTRIVPVLRAIVRSNEFAASVGRKVRTPEEDVVATYRALGVKVRRPQRDGDAANAILWQTNDLGARPFGWPRPDGRPDHAEAWTSPSRMLRSFDMHHTMSGGWWPKTGVGHRTPRSFLPGRKVRFRRLVDHLSRHLLGRPATPALLKAARAATGCRPRTWITAQHAIVRWQMPNLLTVFLDTPTHMSR